MRISYHVARHDSGWAYNLDGVWSEPFPTHGAALDAARLAAGRQQVGGEDAKISFETADGRWHTELSSGGDRPEAEVVDDFPDAEIGVPQHRANAGHIRG